MKILIDFLKILMARIKSKSPKFYVTCRWIAGVLAFFAALVLGAFKINVFHVLPATAAEVVSWCQQIGSGLSGVFLFSFTGTADPKLLEKPESN